MFKIFVFCHFMLDYAPIGLLGNLCFRRWIVQFMPFDAAGINLSALTTTCANLQSDFHET